MNTMQVIELYCWLANKFPLVFTDLASAEELRNQALRSIERGLLELSATASEAAIQESQARRTLQVRSDDGQRRPPFEGGRRTRRARPAQDSPSPTSDGGEKRRTRRTRPAQEDASVLASDRV
jgi:hypothetical protein